MMEYKEYMKKLQAGFTLIELLVVISIIAILSAVGFTAYGDAQKKARDATRAADMKAIQSAFEQYYSTDGQSSYSEDCNDMDDEMPGGIPSDPKGSANPYLVSCTPTASYDYCACATLESGTDAGNASDTSCSFGAGANFCVKNLQ
ncbi:MAG: hypothetical protein COU67_02135 [Candidatus Pacebacteria bacterium CG10_big_fil_rev_8_21_14_0_10_44_54]|nr:MAG: hypothetical protein COU67_02135 [Candidatus Pacebacteria bacterium CG10_big_fil_rev_8_21_14_0_10_44_54]